MNKLISALLLTIGTSLIATYSFAESKCTLLCTALSEEYGAGACEIWGIVGEYAAPIIVLSRASKEPSTQLKLKYHDIIDCFSSRGSGTLFEFHTEGSNKIRVCNVNTLYSPATLDCSEFDSAKSLTKKKKSKRLLPK